ncbi:killer cell lectin-like receptor subfamily B member 1B allele B isoform X2 [Larus michahellis]|uniref:killer cell lectin-like receptor subfamily B member 1B allele B isoform X2 n=1 Tax=Larus michahellis TaxID=119627 RepID=UPI003D9B765C
MALAGSARAPTRPLPPPPPPPSAGPPPGPGSSSSAPRCAAPRAPPVAEKKRQRGGFRPAAAMEEPGGSEVSFSPSWRRDALRRLRRLRRRISSDPLLARLLPGDGSPTPRRSVVVVRGPMPKGKPARDWRRQVWPDPPKLPQLEPCPDDWLYYRKKCYYHSDSRSPADWNSSQEACSNYGASLAVIGNHQELNFIMYRIRITDFWIGLRRKGNKFFWVNGESFDTNLFHVNITNDGDCVHIDSAFISTRKCSSRRNWLCTIGQFNPKTSSY